MQDNDTRKQNLIPFTEMSPSRHSELSRLGQQASAKSRREKKTLKQELEALLEIADKNGDTLQKKISFAIIQKAGKGDVKAYEIIRDTIGQKPKESVAVEIDKNKEDAKQLLDNIKETVKQKTVEKDKGE